MKYAFINGHILDGSEHMEVISHKVILTNNDKIESITDESTSRTGYQEVDLQGAFIMPGLINMHVHLPGSGKPKRKQKDSAKAAEMATRNKLFRHMSMKMCENYARMELMSGVTTIRTVGGLLDYDSQIRDKINRGELVGPRILTSNQAITVEGGHMAGSVARIVGNEKEARQAVDDLVEQHVDFIKLMITGGVMDATEKGGAGALKMPPEIIKAACDEAHRNNLIVAAHVESSEGVRVALENGVDSIEHGATCDEEIIDLFKEHHAFLTTTISPALPFALFDRKISHCNEIQQYNGKLVFDGIIDNAKKALANDIPVALGTDTACPYVTHYDMWRELIYFVKYCGVSPRYALHSATLGNAKLLNVGKITGSITAGKYADMIVTKINPLDDLTTLGNVTHVIMRGKLYKPDHIKKYAEVERQLNPFCKL